MREVAGLELPTTLGELLDPGAAALIVSDVQVGIVGQIADGGKVVTEVRHVLEAAWGEAP